MANPTAPVPARVELRQLLFREKCFGHERIQMVRTTHYATTTGKIPVDGVTAPADCSCDLLAGDALKPRLDYQTPYVVAWTIPFHFVPTICDVASRATLRRSDLRAKSTSRLIDQKKVALYSVLYRVAGESHAHLSFRDEGAGGVFAFSIDVRAMNIPPVTGSTEWIFLEANRHAKVF